MAAKSKISKEQWADARRRWESNPKTTFADFSRELQLTRQAISRKACRDGWSRGDAAKNVNIDINKKVTGALLRLVESPQTAPDVVLRACEMLTKLENSNL